MNPLRFQPMTIAEIDQLPPLTWLIEDHLPQEGLVVLYGPPASGKTFVSLSMALAVACGAPWLGVKVRRPPTYTDVVYIYAEGTRGISKRVHAWVGAQEAAPNLRHFYAIPCAVGLTQDDELREMVGQIKARALRPCLIVVDTLARCFGGRDENSTQDMNKFVSNCDMLKQELLPGCALLIVHHTGKNATIGARGSSALLGAADVEWEVSKVKGTYDHLILKNTKQKEREEFEPRSLLKFDVPGTTSATVRWAPELPAETEEKPAITWKHIIRNAYENNPKISYTEAMEISGKKHSVVCSFLKELRG